MIKSVNFILHIEQKPIFVQANNYKPISIMTNKSFIVPHDFTMVADNALHHAIITAKVVNVKIYVLHVVPKEKDINEAKSKLNKLIATYKEDKIEIIPEVRIGNIFDEIGDFATEHYADLIFMGTHGASGWQHISGSHALKVVTHSAVPFVIVQGKPPRDSGYDDIVVPLDLHKETKQKLSIVASMAKYFKSRVHIVIPNETDEFSKNKIAANILFSKRFFEERNIGTTVTMAPRGGFDKEIVKVGIEKDADLIAIMNLNKNNVFGALGARYEQYIITNDAEIPTLIINPIETPYGSGVLFS